MVMKSNCAIPSRLPRCLSVPVPLSWSGRTLLRSPIAAAPATQWSHRARVIGRAEPQGHTEDDGSDAEDDAPSPPSLLDNLTQAGLLLTVASGLSSWLNVPSWNWDLPLDAVPTVVACGAMPVAFVLAVCVPSYETVPVVGSRSPSASAHSDCHMRPLSGRTSSRLLRFIALCEQMRSPEMDLLCRPRTSNSWRIRTHGQGSYRSSLGQTRRERTGQAAWL